MEVLPLDAKHGGAFGVTVQLTRFEAGTLEDGYGVEGQEAGDPVVYMTVTLENESPDVVDVPPYRQFDASNGPTSTPVDVFGGASWKPKWPTRLLPGRSAENKVALVGEASDMTDLVLTFTMNDLGIQCTWAGDVSSMLE